MLLNFLADNLFWIAFHLLGKSYPNSNAYTILDLGNTTLIEGMVDRSNIDAGFVYAIAEGDSIRIPVSHIKYE